MVNNMNEEFLNKVEDFLEKGAELNKFTYAISENKKIHQLKVGRESLILINHLMSENAILNGEIQKINYGFSIQVFYSPNLAFYSLLNSFSAFEKIYHTADNLW